MEDRNSGWNTIWEEEMTRSHCHSLCRVFRLQTEMKAWVPREGGSQPAVPWRGPCESWRGRYAARWPGWGPTRPQACCEWLLEGECVSATIEACVCEHVAFFNVFVGTQRSLKNGGGGGRDKGHAWVLVGVYELIMTLLQQRNQWESIQVYGLPVHD